MKKMIYFAAFVIMMAMGNMNAFANKNGAKHNDVLHSVQAQAEHMNGKNKVKVRYDAHHLDMNGHKMSHHERMMMEQRRREEERRRMEEARREEERRKMEEARRREEAARHHHKAHHHDVVVVNNNVAAGVVAGVAVAALIGALAH